MNGPKKEKISWQAPEFRYQHKDIFCHRDTSPFDDVGRILPLNGAEDSILLECLYLTSGVSNKYLSLNVRASRQQNLE